MISTLKIKRKESITIIFWTQQFLFMKFPPSSLDDLIGFFSHEKLTDHIKSWHLHSRTMSQNLGNSAQAILSYYLSFLQMK